MWNCAIAVIRGKYKAAVEMLKRHEKTVYSFYLVLKMFL